MKRSKKMLTAGALSLGLCAGAILSTPSAMRASNNVVLASVDWVNSKLNPINTQLSTLQTNINNQQATISKLQTTIANQQNEINSLKGTNSSTTPTTTNSSLPSVVYVSKSTVVIRRGATTSYAVVATKSIGTSLKVIDSFTSSSGLWYRVQLSSTLFGWINSGDVSTTNVTNTKLVVTTGNVYLRKGATKSYPAVTLINMNTTLTYIQSFKNSYGETWYNVETSSGLRGWIISSLGEVK